MFLESVCVPNWKKPNNSMSAAHLFDSHPHFYIQGIQHFVTSLKRNQIDVSPQQPVSGIFKFTQIGRITCWNVSSLGSDKQCQDLLPILKAKAKNSIVLLQETKRIGHGSPLRALIPAAHVLETQAMSTEAEGASGGLHT